MASRLARGAIGVTRTRPAIPPRCLPPISTALASHRHASNVPAQEPAAKAQSLIDSLPGNSLVSKTAILSGGFGLATWLIANEIYVTNEETVTFVCWAASIAGMVYYGKPYYLEWANGHIERQRSVLNEAKEGHRTVIKERLDSLQELSGVIDITRGLFDVARDTAKLEADAFELEQKTKVTAEAKNVLESWVRYESQLKQRQQRDLAENVINKITKELENPRNLQQILNQSVTDVEKILSSKSQ